MVAALLLNQEVTGGHFYPLSASAGSSGEQSNGVSVSRNEASQVAIIESNDVVESRN